MVLNKSIKWKRLCAIDDSPTRSAIEEVVNHCQDRLVEVVKRLVVGRWRKWNVFDFLVQHHNEKVCLFSSSYEKECILRYTESRSCSSFLQLVLTLCFLCIENMSLFFNNILASLDVPKTRRHANIPDERPQFHVKSDIRRSSRKEGYVVLKHKRPWIVQAWLHISDVPRHAIEDQWDSNVVPVQNNSFVRQ